MAAKGLAAIRLCWGEGAVSTAVYIDQTGSALEQETKKAAPARKGTASTGCSIIIIGKVGALLRQPTRRV